MPGARSVRLRARASLAVGLHAEALEALRSVRRTGRGADPPTLEEAEALLGLLRFDECAAVTTRALRRKPLDPETNARLRGHRGHALWQLGQVRAGEAELRRAAGQATAPLTRARAEELLALVAWKVRRLGDVEGHLAAARHLYQECGSAEGMAGTLGIEAGVLRDAGRFKEALDLLGRRVEIASTTTRLDAIAEAYSDRGDLLAFLGRWEEAGRDLDRAAQLFRRLSDPREFSSAASRRAMVDLAHGDLNAVSSALRQAGSSVARTDLRTLSEHLLLASDLYLAAGDPDAADRDAAQAVGLFVGVRDRDGECRARVRRTHALLGMQRVDEAVREARRAVSLASASRSDLSMLALLALGRALLRGRSGEAVGAFSRAADLSASRPALAPVARLGRALARGADRRHPEVEAALGSLERWGDRRVLAYCLSDLRELFGDSPASPPPDPPPTATVGRACAAAGALADAAICLAGEGPWPARWAGAMRALLPAAGWWRAAWIGEEGWELRRDLVQPVRLAGDDLATLLAERAEGMTQIDLTASEALRVHPTRVLHGVAHAVLVPVRPGAILYFDVREGERATLARQAGLVQEVARLLACHAPEPEPEASSPHRYPEIVGRCPALQELFEQMAQLARSDVAVHVFGETGTGKEKVARALHAHSVRSHGPFVAINASSLSDELFESEMFGHTRGAFSGAVAARAGHVAEAEGGTLFIDEVAELTPRGQAKLLRLVQEREYRRLGETQTRMANVRFVTAANADLEKRVAAGLFREDLLFRLTVVSLRLPPLRERGDDVLILARHFLRSLAAREGRPVPALPRSVAEALRGYAWPGNVRELTSEMHRLVLRAGNGPIRPGHLSPRIMGRQQLAGGSLRSARAAFEREFISGVLPRYGGNRTRAACALGITRQALVIKMRQLGL